MAWSVRGRSLELCNCKQFCPCWLGPTGEPDEGWCGAAFGYDIEEGSSDGVDLGGCQVALAFEWPGNFFGGNGSGRLYVDEAASAEQRRELEAIFVGKKGGPLAAVWDAVITKWLPTQATSIDIQWGEKPSLRVGDVGQATLSPLKDPSGQPTQIKGAAAQAALGIEQMDLADAVGSRWSDPDLRAFEGDDGTLHTFDWAA